MASCADSKNADGSITDSAFSPESVGLGLRSKVEGSEVCYQLTGPYPGNANKCVELLPGDTVTIAQEAVVRPAKYRYLVGVAAPGITQVVAQGRTKRYKTSVTDQSFILAWPLSDSITSLSVRAGARQVDFIECDQESGC